jgi:CheY-like chemotaxis protein
MVLAIDPVRIWDLGQAVDQAFCSPRTESPTDGVGGGLLQRILLVDDSLSARVSMAKRLQRLGFETSEACDGMEALDRLRSDSFALVVTDLDMPRLGGLELLNELRLRRMIDVPVAVVSGRTEPEIQSRAIRYGARCFLNKPVNDELLKRMLQDVGLLSN